MTGELYAMKVLSKIEIKNLNMSQQAINEIQIMKTLSHENIIRYYSHFEDTKHIYLILELAEDRNLYSLLRKKKKFEEKIAAEYLFQVGKAVAYLHSHTHPIIHRDIKPENLLFANGMLKLADFGASNTKSRHRNTFCGTAEYLAPEMFVGKGHSEKIDIWTIGILMYEMLIGEPPFHLPKGMRSYDFQSANKALERLIRVTAPAIPSTISNRAAELIMLLLSKMPEDRPTAEEFLSHQWFKDYGFVYEGDKSLILGDGESILVFRKDSDELRATINKSQENKGLDFSKMTITDLSKISIEKAFHELQRKYKLKKQEASELLEILKLVCLKYNFRKKELSVILRNFQMDLEKQMGLHSLKKRLKSSLEIKI